MTRVRNVVVLTVGPGGAEALCATTRDGKSFSVRKQSALTWEDPGLDLSVVEATLSTLLKEVTAGIHGAISGAVALHPSWVLCRTVDVPPASASRVQSFLQLWTDRQFPARDFGTMRLGWRPMNGDRKKALVLLARENTLAPIERAFRAASADPAFATASSFVQASLLETNGTESLLLVSLLKEGAAAVELSGAAPTSLRWIPEESETSVANPQSLLNYFLRKTMEAHAGQSMVVAGAGAEELRRSVSSTRAVSADWQRSLEKRQLIPGAGTFKPGEETLFALLPSAAGKRNGLPNLARQAHFSAEALRKISPIAEGKRGTKLIITLAAALLVLIVGGHFLQRSLFAASEERAGAMQVDEVAASENISILSRIESERRNPLDVLLALKELKPDNINLNGIQYDQKDSFTITGTTDSWANVEQFVVKLNGSKMFTGVQTQTMPKEGREVKFTVRGRLGRVR